MITENSSDDVVTTADLLEAQRVHEHRARRVSHHKVVSGFTLTITSPPEQFMM